MDEVKLILEIKAIIDNANELGLDSQRTAELIVEELQQPDLRLALSDFGFTLDNKGIRR